MKRLISLLLVLAMALSLLCTVSAASPEATEAADALHDLGLFQGVGTNQDGTPNYDLDRAPNRYEAVTMLVRLLGKEEEAKAGAWKTPFKDVAEWAKPYVGYAYQNKLTSGISADKFGGTGLVTASQYITFVLRALGYDSSTDFKWDAAWELSDKLSITTGQYNASSTFTRGDAAIISNRALDVAIVDSNDTMFGRLKKAGAVTSPYPDAMDIKRHFSYLGNVSLVKFKGKIYSLLAPSLLPGIYSPGTLEPYVPAYTDDGFFLIFQDIKSIGNDNPYVDGALFTDNFTDSVMQMERERKERETTHVAYIITSDLERERFKYTSESGWVSASNTLHAFTLQANGKTFKSITAEEFLSAGLKDGDNGVWNGVRYIVEGNTSIYYNMNDIAKYFGVDRSFHVERGDEDCYLVIE